MIHITWSPILRNCRPTSCQRAPSRLQSILCCAGKAAHCARCPLRQDCAPGLGKPFPRGTLRCGLFDSPKRTSVKAPIFTSRSPSKDGEDTVELEIAAAVDGKTFNLVPHVELARAF